MLDTKENILMANKQCEGGSTCNYYKTQDKNLHTILHYTLTRIAKMQQITPNVD